MKRVFAAIKIQPNDAFLDLYQSLRKQLQHERINWVAPQNIHITLKFFGETHEERIPEIIKVLNRVAQKNPMFQLSIQRVGIFGSSYSPKVIWFGIEPQIEIRALANDVLDSVAEIGWPRDRQNFVPHLTVGRIKELKDKKGFQKIIDTHKNADIQTVGVQEFKLIESVLKREGAQYFPLETFPLGIMMPPVAREDF